MSASILGRRLTSSRATPHLTTDLDAIPVVETNPEGEIHENPLIAACIVAGGTVSNIPETGFLVQARIR